MHPSIIPDSVFLESARALADSVTDQDLSMGAIYPLIDEIREVSLNIAAAVAHYAYANGLTEEHEPDNLIGYIRGLMFDPNY